MMNNSYETLPVELSKKIRIAISMFALADERQGTFDFKEVVNFTNEIMGDISNEFKKRDDELIKLRSEVINLQSKIDNLRMGGNENGR